MKKKEIITIAIAVIIMAVSGYFIYRMLAPAQLQNQNQKSQIPEVPVEFDETTYKSINTLSDYGKPSLSGIGKSDLFGGF